LQIAHGGGELPADDRQDDVDHGGVDERHGRGRDGYGEYERLRAIDAIFGRASGGDDTLVARFGLPPEHNAFPSPSRRDP
jgi:hypothetical protein